MEIAGKCWWGTGKSLRGGCKSIATPLGDIGYGGEGYDKGVGGGASVCDPGGHPRMLGVGSCKPRNHPPALPRVLQGN